MLWFTIKENPWTIYVQNLIPLWKRLIPLNQSETVFIQLIFHFPAEVSRNGVDHTCSFATLSVHGSVRPFWPFTLLVQWVQVVDLKPLYHWTIRWFSSAAITRQTCGQSPAYSGMSVHTKSPSLYNHGVGATAGRVFPIMAYKTKDYDKTWSSHENFGFLK